MIDTIAVVTFLLLSGNTKVVSVYPPGGEYHPGFAWICDRNKMNVREQIRKMYEDKKLVAPDDAEKILQIEVRCVASIKM